MKQKTGKQIKTIQDLRQAANDKKAVIAPKSQGLCRTRIPASFVINFQGWIIARLLDKGLYIYKPKGGTE